MPILDGVALTGSGRASMFYDTNGLSPYYIERSTNVVRKVIKIIEGYNGAKLLYWLPITVDGRELLLVSYLTENGTEKAVTFALNDDNVTDLSIDLR